MSDVQLGGDRNHRVIVGSLFASAANSIAILDPLVRLGYCDSIPACGQEVRLRCAPEVLVHYWQPPRSLTDLVDPTCAHAVAFSAAGRSASAVVTAAALGAHARATAHDPRARYWSFNGDGVRLVTRRNWIVAFSEWESLLDLFERDTNAKLRRGELRVGAPQGPAAVRSRICIAECERWNVRVRIAACITEEQVARRACIVSAAPRVGLGWLAGQSHFLQNLQYLWLGAHWSSPLRLHLPMGTIDGCEWKLR